MPTAEDSQGRRTSNKLKIQYETANLLAASDSVELAAPRLLGMLCELLDWDVAALWEVDPEADNLKCVAIHMRPGCDEERFLEFTRRHRFRRGEGLPGGIWEKSGPDFIPDVREHPVFPRKSAVNELVSAAGFPILNGRHEVRGIFEFFSCRQRSDDRDELVDLMAAVGNQLVQFVERCRAEQSAKSQGSWLEVTLASIGDAVLATDVQGHVRFLNSAAESLTGWTLEQARGQDLHQVLHLLDEVTGSPVTVKVEQTIKDDARRAMKLLSRSQETRFVEVRSTPIQTAEGGVLGVVVVVRDVTERREAERHARESELSYRRMLDTTYEGIWILDPEARITYANQRLGQMLGYAPDELMGRAVSDLFFPEDSGLLDQIVQARREGRAEQSDLRLRHKRGLEVWALTSASPIYDSHGRFMGSFAMLTDVTDRRREEDQLRRSEERMRSLVEASSQAIWMARRDGAIAEDSPTWRALTGQSYEELKGLGWLDAVHSEDRARIRERWLEAVEKGELFAEEFRVWSVQNRFLYMSSRGVPVRSEDGRVLEWIVANTDTTGHVEALQQLQERARHAAFHASVKDSLASEKDFDTLVGQCLEAMIRELGLCTAFLVMRGENGLELTAHRGPLPEEPIDWNATELARMASTRRSHFANTLPRDLVFPDQAWMEREKLVAFAGQPIVSGDETLGVVGGFARQVLLVNVLDVIKELADGICGWTRRRKDEEFQAALLQSEQQARSQAETLLKLSTAFARETSRKRLVQTVVDACTQLTGAAFGSFFYNVANEKGESYMLYAISGVPPEAFSSFPMPRNTAVFAPTFYNEGTMHSDDITQDPRFGHNEPYHGLPPGHLPVRSYLAVSVVSQTKEVYGGLFFGHPEPGRFSQRHREIAELLAAKAGLAFDRAPLTDE